MTLVMMRRSFATMRSGPNGTGKGNDPGQDGSSHSAALPWLLLLTLVVLFIWAVLDPFKLSPVLTGWSLPTLVLSVLES
jgi:hypothetical protein